MSVHCSGGDVVLLRAWLRVLVACVFGFLENSNRGGHFIKTPTSSNGINGPLID
jgi:hypothetical protein